MGQYSPYPKMFSTQGGEGRIMDLDQNLGRIYTNTIIISNPRPFPFRILDNPHFRIANIPFKTNIFMLKWLTGHVIIHFVIPNIIFSYWKSILSIHNQVFVPQTCLCLAKILGFAQTHLLFFWKKKSRQKKIVRFSFYYS